MDHTQNAWRRLAGTLLSRAPLLAYGELVLKPLVRSDRRNPGCDSPALASEHTTKVCR
jgi:hypothetical protein